MATVVLESKPHRQAKARKSVPRSTRSLPESECALIGVEIVSKGSKEAIKV